MVHRLDSHDEHEISTLPDDMLLHNMRCAEDILANAKQFPQANIDHVQARWAAMVGEAAGRALPQVMECKRG